MMLVLLALTGCAGMRCAAQPAAADAPSPPPAATPAVPAPEPEPVAPPAAGVPPEAPVAAEPAALPSVAEPAPPAAPAPAPAAPAMTPPAAPVAVPKLQPKPPQQQPPPRADPKPAVATVPKPAAAPATPPAPAMDLASLEKRLKETSAIGVVTKLTLKNQVDDLLDRFRAHYQGKSKTTLAQLRQPYDLLILKVLTLLQDGDPTLARAIADSREAIWAILSDPGRFKAL